MNKNDQQKARDNYIDERLEGLNNRLLRLEKQYNCKCNCHNNLTPGAIACTECFDKNHRVYKKYCTCETESALFNDFGMIKCQYCMGIIRGIRLAEIIKYNTKLGGE